MEAKEKLHLMKHFERAAYSHGELAEVHRKLSKTHGLLAKAHGDAGASVIAEHHRDLGLHHGSAADQHDNRQADYQRLRTHLAGESGADVIDEHSDATSELREAQEAELLKMAVGE